MGKSSWIYKKKYFDIILEVVFLLLLAFYSSYLLLASTTFYIKWPDKLEEYMLIVVSVVVFLRVLIRGKIDRNILYAFFVGFVYFLSYKSTGYILLLFLALFTIGCMDIYYKKVIFLQIVVMSLVVGSAFLASACGSINNLVYFEELGKIRGAFGICYPTDFAAYLFYLLILLWVLFEPKSNLFFIILGSIVSFIIIKYTAGTNSFICCTLFVFLCTFLEIKKHFSNNSLLHKLEKCFCRFIVYSFPSFALLFFGLMFLFYKNIIIVVKIDEILNHRVSLAYNAWKNHGFSLFGSAFDQIGAGGSTIANPYYNFVDSTYPLVMIRYGAALFLAIMIIWIFLSKKAVKNNRLILAFAMYFISLHSFSEHHFPELNYNIILLLLFTNLNFDIVKNKYTFFSKFEKDSNNKIWNKKLLIHFLYLFFCMIFTGCFVKKILIIIKTIADTNSFNATPYNYIFLFFLYLLLTLFFIIILFTFAIIYLDVFVYKNFKLISLYFSTSFIILMVIFIPIVEYGLITKVEHNYKNIIEKEKEIIDIILDAKQGKVYSEVVPLLYLEKYDDEICYSLLSADMLSRQKNCTIIKEDRGENSCLIKQGFLYFDMKDGNALYTNDKGVASALQKKAYKLTGYYSHHKELDICFEATKSGLETKDRSVHIYSDSQPLVCGPYTMYEGDYCVNYKLKIIDEYIGEDYQVCTLLINSSWGQNRLGTLEVYRSQFDENGELDVNLEFYTTDNDAIEIFVIGKSGFLLEVNNISCYRKPKYDIHVSYSKNYSICKKEYYNVESGFPEYVVYGCCAVEQEFSRKRNLLIKQSYYDEMGQKVFCSDGYAIVKYEYDENMRIVREYYFDQNERMILSNDNYAIKEYFYDEENNVIENRFYGINNNLTKTNQGFAIARYSYNEKKQCVSIEYFDENDSRVLLEDNYSCKKMCYDENGNVVKIEYYGTNDEPTLFQNQYFKIDYVYENNKKVFESYFNIDNELTYIDAGYVACSFGYDDNGNECETCFYDRNGNLTLCMGGYARRHLWFDDNGNVVKDEYFGLNSELENVPEGYAYIIYKYDSLGNVIECQYYDKYDNRI